MVFCCHLLHLSINYNVMRKLLFYPLFVIIFNNCISKNQLIDTKKIYEKSYACLELKTHELNYYKNIRLNALNELRYSKSNDTLFILEKYTLEGNFIFTVWNEKDTISYSNTTGSFEMTHESLYTKHMMKLVSEWNLLEIEKEEEINSNLIPQEIIYASRITLNNGDLNSNCMVFKDFLNFKRDFGY